MSDKPSYLSLLNYLAQNESEAHAYLTAWAEVTPSAEVKCVLLKVAAREGEHGMSFLKRMDELGYALKPRDTDCEKVLGIARSDKSDLEKFEIFGLHKLDRGDGPDPFDDFFKDHSIDIETGALLGRYICEERDTARLLRACYEQLVAAAPKRKSDKSEHKADKAEHKELKALDKKVDALCRAVDELRQIVVAQAMPADAS
jgi:rubrerythrin